MIEIGLICVFRMLEVWHICHSERYRTHLCIQNVRGMAHLSIQTDIDRTHLFIRNVRGMTHLSFQKDIGLICVFRMLEV